MRGRSNHLFVSCAVMSCVGTGIMGVQKFRKSSEIPRLVRGYMYSIIRLCDMLVSYSFKYYNFCRSWTKQKGIKTIWMWNSLWNDKVADVWASIGETMLGKVPLYGPFSKQLTKKSIIFPQSQWMSSWGCWFQCRVNK